MLKSYHEHLQDLISTLAVYCIAYCYYTCKVGIKSCRKCFVSCRYGTAQMQLYAMCIAYTWFFHLFPAPACACAHIRYRSTITSFLHACTRVAPRGFTRVKC